MLLDTGMSYNSGIHISVCQEETLYNVKWIQYKTNRSCIYSKYVMQYKIVFVYTCSCMCVSEKRFGRTLVKQASGFYLFNFGYKGNPALFVRSG